MRKAETVKSVLQVSRKNSLGLFRNVEFVESAADFSFVATFGMIFKIDADNLAVGGQGLEGKTPALGFSQALAQFGFVGNRNTVVLRWLITMSRITTQL